ncbi:OX-2 membrane glycoprotein-like isoform X2 [Brienomyrus brachyistius]|uniref:OX-2 membrane glycoprotein-like isoform X2 n=1 Tax=Brienomyrus brachyistius TaxID=42636 RepID=UPI0020B3A7B2|nr:OX-2 membrane glycoprotein-like isoform X2 [Brienomyrus brachyistius]
MTVFSINDLGFTELVRTQRLVMASLGDDVNIACELTQQKNVKQVTWQRVSEQTSENMATYSERFGSKITESFRKNVSFMETELQQSAIVIRRVQWSDESCYKCLFNVFPDGAISGRTCLNIYELHNPVFEVTPVNVGDDRRLSLSCSATGRPAPKVSWSIEDSALENSTTLYTKNPNGTITVTKTATVQITPTLLANTTQIKCAAQQEFGERKEIFITIPNDDITSDTRHTVFSYAVPVLGVLCGFLGLFLCVSRRNLKVCCFVYSAGHVRVNACTFCLVKICTLYNCGNCLEWLFFSV